MKIVEDLLGAVLHISEGKPYHGYIKISGPDVELKFDGDVIFDLHRGNLNFEFYPDYPISGVVNRDIHTALAKSMQDAATTVLTIPSHDFEYEAILQSLPHEGMRRTGVPIDRSVMKGLIRARHFGSPCVPLTSVSALLRYLPSDWYIDDLRYHSGFDPDRLGSTLLSAVTLTANGWEISLQEIPSHFDDANESTHAVNVSREDNSLFTGERVFDLLTDLNPFLSFVFGQTVEFTVCIGSNRADSSYPNQRWGFLIPHAKKDVVVNRKRNWFFKSRWQKADLSTLYRTYSDTSDERRRQLAKIMRFYAVSEDIVATLGEFEAAYSVSFSVLEGLIKFMISGYGDEISSEWLTKGGSLKRSKGIANAINLVLDRSISETPDSGAIRENSLSLLKDVRNETVHMDPTAEDQGIGIYYRWNSVQALIEIILLAHLGMKHIPNRTIPPIANIMGEDTLAQARREQLRI